LPLEDLPDPPDLEGAEDRDAPPEDLKDALELPLELDLE
jgi:hypothetical protein